MRTVLVLSLLPVVFLACRSSDKGDEGEIGFDPTLDVDADGYTTDQGDCDDADAEVNPGAEELCNGVDDDCDGDVDEGVTSEWYADLDGDGYGDPDAAEWACEQPEGAVADATDCDDLDADVYPEAPERCDEVDNDCDGAVDEEVTELWHADADGDGFGDPESTLDSCDPEAGWVADDSDCDDASDAVFPGADEWCNGADDDCDGEVDEDAVDAPTWYADADGDGYGDEAVSETTCDQPSGWVDDTTDCDDGDAAVNPGADELCSTEGVDDDCDGEVDEDDAAGALTWYADADGDSYGDAASTSTACEEPAGHVADSSDCDDDDDDIHPAASERCNGEDDDCDGTVDEDDAVDAETWYADADGDGFGDASSTTAACSEPTGYTDDDTDCDDTDAAVNPDADELCSTEGVDDDCDGDVDEDSASDASTWYGDADGDGYGGSTFTDTACDQPSGYVDNTDDCDDLDADVSPLATELCDGVDNDCDGTTDEDAAADAATWYADGDGDGHGDSAGGSTTACSEPSGYAATDDDCDDSDATISPSATEACNGVDDDCDGAADDGVVGSDSTCAAGSCLEVLEDGSPTDSDWYWLDPDGSGAYEEYCDYGTVGGGWSYRLELEIDNPTSGDLSDEWVAVSLDTETLVDDGKLEADGLDLRFFTHDGPLLEYWYAGLVGEGSTTVWIQVPELPAGSTTDLTITYGNADTERKSLSWWFDSFDDDTSASYSTEYASSWGTPSWTWDTSASAVETDSTNMDYFLLVDDSRLSLDEPVYVEARVSIYDDDAIGPLLYDSGTGYVAATASDDYDGVAHSGGQECILENSSVPTAHYQGSYLLELGDLETPSSTRVGLYWDGSELAYYLDGTEEGAVSASGYAFEGAGIATYANSGSPGADAEYLFVGSEPIDFDPEGLSSDATASTGSEATF